MTVNILSDVDDRLSHANIDVDPTTRLQDHSRVELGRAQRG